MTSERQIEANRKNARRSTGPKTATGKAKSSRNAFRHGLSRRTRSDEVAVERVAATMPLEPTAALPIDSTDLVRTKLDLVRIRSTRARMLKAVLQNPDLKLLNSLRGLLRYERAAFARQKRLMKGVSGLKR
jgi:hypothetical protein